MAQAFESGSAVDSLLREATYRSADGLSLFVRDYGDRLSPWLPVVCLPGLTRTHRDFHDLARTLSTHRHRPRRVLCFDYRGRGRSDRDGNFRNYNPLTEMADVFDGMAAFGVNRAVIVGTSRGGIIAMLMAVARPAVLAGVVLNDIGPVLEPVGLARIKTYVGRTPLPDDWADAVRILKRLHGGHFTALTDEQWLHFARMSYRDEDGRPVPDCDPSVAQTLASIDFDEPLPSLWNEFRALRPKPVLSIRGANSDLLSATTVAAMAAEHPMLESLTVPGEGHAPILAGNLLQRIASFVAGVEGSGPPVESVLPRPLPLFDLDAPKPEAGRSGDA